MSYSETLTTGNLCPLQCASRCPLAHMCAYFWSTVGQDILPSGKFTYHLTTLLRLSIFGRFSSLSTAVYPFTAHFHYEGTPICAPHRLPDTKLLFPLVFLKTFGSSNSFLKRHWLPNNFRKRTVDTVTSDNTHKHKSLLFSGYRGSFVWIKRPGHDADHSPPSSSELKNEWSYTSTPPPGHLYAFTVWTEKKLF